MVLLYYHPTELQLYMNVLIYSPRVLFLYEYDEQNNEITGSYQLNYLPSEILGKEFCYTNKGSESEDNLEYELQITGYEIREEHKHIFEKPNNIAFNFNRFKYYLWAKYPAKEMDKSF